VRHAYIQRERERETAFQKNNFSYSGALKTYKPVEISAIYFITISEPFGIYYAYEK
jgi:hypothetical protein